MDLATDAYAANDGDLVVSEAIELVELWLRRSTTSASTHERRIGQRLEAIVHDPSGVANAMRFAEGSVVGDEEAADQMSLLVGRRGRSGLFASSDRLLAGVGARVATHLPEVVAPLAQRRLRQLAGHLVADAGGRALTTHIDERRTEGGRLNLKLVGDAVLGDRQADRRLEALLALLDRPDVDRVSVAASSIAANLNMWDLDAEVDRVIERLRPLFARAAADTSAKSIDLDLTSYAHLELTVRAFTSLLEEPQFHRLDAGIALQTYLPDSYPVLRGLVDWSNRRHRFTIDGRPGGAVRVRVVKGSNLGMERVTAAINGWVPAPYATKAETDANFKRCLDWLLHRQRLAGVRVAVATHNLFDVAWVHLLAKMRGVDDRVDIEMFHGLAPAQARMVRGTTGGVSLYTPVVHGDQVDAAVVHLLRLLGNMATPDNFVRHLFSIHPDGPEFEAEKAKFVAAVARRWSAADGPRRTQDRSTDPAGIQPQHPSQPFANTPNTDPVLEPNRLWLRRVLAQPPDAPKTEMVRGTAPVDQLIDAAEAGGRRWGGLAAIERRRILSAVADELTRRRGDLIAALAHEGSKTVGEADAEASAAIDFARWYARSAEQAGQSPSARFSPLGVVAVVTPWSCPVSAPAGGVLAVLAAGNSVILKPAPDTPRCAEIVAECCWAAGIGDALQFLRIPDGPIGRHLITQPAVKGLVFTGSRETAQLFRQWRPGLPIFGGTSGKNAMVITPNADIDLAVADLVASAFGHGGQKCSAASIAICVGDVYESSQFRRQLVDAARSLRTGSAAAPGTELAPLLRPGAKLERALADLESGEDWLLAPKRLDENLWSPGIRLGVRPGSWFHNTECFGPVLGLMPARDLDDAIALQNATEYGLTGGLHSLDPTEIEQWCRRVDVGNAYVNRTTTGSIVGRQPFGGWKRSVIGPGAKSGGPNYVNQFGTWRPTDGNLDDAVWLTNAAVSDARWWSDEYGVDHDIAGLYCEANVFRYRPLVRVAVRLQPDGLDRERRRVEAAAAICGVEVVVSDSAVESAAAFAARLPTMGVSRVRVIGTVDPELRAAANDVGVYLVEAPVTSDGRLELAHYVREQVVSRSLHRYGNLTG